MVWLPNQVLDALPSGLRPGHDRGDVGPPVDHEPEGCVDLRQGEYSIPGSELTEPGSVYHGDEPLVGVNRLIVGHRQRYEQPAAAVLHRS